ncbi:hypothetical protein LCGC14_0353280 [marine sediment metagenome]|uniref:Uncharacterized protein n=1 Tax=marine sediment metagenome TaxID=412755 RepID=A0A0F9VXA5_9ZZZZ
MTDPDQETIDQENEDLIHDLLRSGSRAQIPIKSIDRLAATINQHMIVTADWTLLTEQLDTLEAMAHPETGTKISAVRSVVENEIKQLLKVAAPVHLKLTTVEGKIMMLAAECDHPLREDVKRAFPKYLRERVDVSCFADIPQPTAEAAN